MQERRFAAEQMAVRAGDAARFLKAIANETRLTILCLLIDGELSVGEISDRFDLSQSALSQHLAVLRRDGLVETRRKAQTIYYRLADGPVEPIIRTLHEIYCSGNARGGPRQPRAGRKKR